MSSVDVLLQLVATLDRRVTDLEARLRESERRVAALETRSVSAPQPAAPKEQEVRAEAPRSPAETSQQHAEHERTAILGALTKHDWNKVRAANELGMPRRTFYRRLKEYGIE